MENCFNLLLWLVKWNEKWIDLLIKCGLVGLVTSKLLLLLLQYSSNSSNTRTTSTLSPRWVFYVDSETFLRLPYLVIGQDGIDTGVLPPDVVHVEVGAGGGESLARGWQVPASLLSPGIFCYGWICFCIYSENIGAVHFKIDFFYCINELRLIWKWK